MNLFSIGLFPLTKSHTREDLEREWMFLGRWTFNEQQQVSIGTLGSLHALSSQAFERPAVDGVMPFVARTAQAGQGQVEGHQHDRQAIGGGAWLRAECGQGNSAGASHALSANVWDRVASSRPRRDRDLRHRLHAVASCAC
eukprot:5130279-Pleurochrysis_carterae.AAC.2